MVAQSCCRHWQRPQLRLRNDVAIDGHRDGLTQLDVVVTLDLRVGEPEVEIGNVATTLDALTTACYYLTVERASYRSSDRVLAVNDSVAAIAEQRGRVVSKNQILTQVWGYDAYDPNLVEVHLSALRHPCVGDLA